MIPIEDNTTYFTDSGYIATVNGEEMLFACEDDYLEYIDNTTKDD